VIPVIRTFDWKVIFMRRQQFFSCMLLIIFLCSLTPLSTSQAAMKLELTPYERGFSYAYSLPGEDFSILWYSTPSETGRLVLCNEEGQYSGDVSLPLSGEGGKLRVWVEDLNQKKQADVKIDLPAAADYQPAAGASNAKVKNFVLSSTPQGFSYSFSAADCDYLLLYYRNKQESGILPVYPDENSSFSGEIILPMTYSYTLSTVQVQSGKKRVLAEKTVRKGYEYPAAPAAQPGRLSGVVVCIDPGHQEFGKAVRTPAGPGLTGYIKGTSGMAQGVVTLRKEFIVTMEAAVKLRDELLRQGATVFLTREEPYTFLSNLDRSLIAEEGGAHIMLRLHCDLRENRKTQGISVYGPRNSDYARAVADPDTYRHMGELLINAMKNRLGYELTEATGRVRINDQFVGNNWAKMICFLVEMGFMSNPEEDIKLATPEYQQWLAEGMAQGVYEIALFRGLIQPENPEQ